MLEERPPAPEKSCWDCKGIEYWYRPTLWGQGEWLCSRCHPEPREVKMRNKPEQIIRVFPGRTQMTPKDDYAFVGDPPMIRPEKGEVHISVTFTWDIQRAWYLKDAWSQYYPDVKIGGPALDSPVNGFVPGKYVKSGVTFTSRGCDKSCPWCFVPGREGELREIDFYSGHIVQDNNLLQCSKEHLNRVFTMLSGQKQIQLSGGLDATLVTGEIADSLRNLSIHQMFLSCDTKESLMVLKKAVAKLSGFTRNQLRCYVLIGYQGETKSEAIARLQDVWAVGCMPFAQLYQPKAKNKMRYDSEWRDLARFWSRPAIMKTAMRNHPRWSKYGSID